MDDLKTRHRKEQRDLQSQITQKKKSASKKNRKIINDECTELERQLKARQDQEIAQLSTGGNTDNGLSEKEEASDDNLLAAIVSESGKAESQHETQTPNEETTADSSQPHKKVNRQKARLARRTAEQDAIAAQAAEEAASLPDKKEQERTKMLEELRKRNLVEKEVAANGHCMYSAIADQMRQMKLSLDPQNQEDTTSSSTELQRDDYKIIRHATAGYISDNPDDFVPFLEEPLNDYVSKIRNTGEWGGQTELLALARTYALDIYVLQSDGRVEKIESGAPESKGDAWLAYYRHSFGLGEHYNSLRKNAGSNTST